MSVEGRPLDDAALIERAKRGDAAAYEQLVRIHQTVALRVAVVVVGDRHEAEDVVQEAFVKAHRNLHRFVDTRPFRPWLLQIVRNEARNRRRRAGRQARLAVRVAADPISGGAAPSPETAVLADERRVRLLAAVDALPDRYRLVVACRFLVGLSEAETAETLSIPPGTVKSRTSRGLQQLRQALEEDPDE